MIYCIYSERGDDLKKNRQSERTKKNVYNALIELMKGKSFDQISIVNIVVEADIARLTFYRNYSSKEDVVVDRKSVV